MISKERKRQLERERYAQPINIKNKRYYENVVNTASRRKLQPLLCITGTKNSDNVLKYMVTLSVSEY
jgi:hypothetical protein